MDLLTMGFCESSAYKICRFSATMYVVKISQKAFISLSILNYLKCL